MTIHLVGPGGAGKSTVGALLADRLHTRLIDLDMCFLEREGDISAYLNRYGYEAYAHQNVDTYRAVAPADGGVVALSSGFMTYADDVHRSYVEIRAAIAAGETTFVLLPSLDEETCVAETVRRQVGRPLGLVAAREEAKIRRRFSRYLSLPARKVETMRPADQIVTEIVRVLPRQPQPPAIGTTTPI